MRLHRDLRHSSFVTRGIGPTRSHSRYAAVSICPDALAQPRATAYPPHLALAADASLCIGVMLPAPRPSGCSGVNTGLLLQHDFGSPGTGPQHGLCTLEGSLAFRSIGAVRRRTPSKSMSKSDPPEPRLFVPRPTVPLLSEFVVATGSLPSKKRSSLQVLSFSAPAPHSMGFPRCPCPKDPLPTCTSLSDALLPSDTRRCPTGISALTRKAGFFQARSSGKYQREKLQSPDQTQKYGSTACESTSRRRVNTSRKTRLYRG